ncbi:MAG: N-acetylneuraminate synthase [Thermoguttaceae bacterium]|jgi:N-acetylneuraminate synthase
MVKIIEIGGKKVGLDQPCFIIAEAGVNHNGDLDMALQLVEAARAVGADAVKFQTFRAEKLASALAVKASYQVETTGAAESQLQMLKRLELSPQSHSDLIAHCRGQGIIFLSSPFDEESADFLETLQVPAFKIPSGEIVNIPFLSQVARKGKPIILSTGMATLGEVETAVNTIREAGNPGLVLLHCVSNYPAAPADVNLRAMQTMAKAFQVPVGYSDHVLGNEVAFAAVAMGACVVEKHFTLDRNLPGPDHRASLEPDELTALVQGIRTVEKALGDGCKRPAASEADTAAAARKSLVAAKDILAGTVLSLDMIAVKRPGTGLPPSMSDFVLGRKLRRNVAKNSLLTLDDLT